MGGNPFLLGNPSAPGAGYEGFKVALGWHGAPFGGGLGSGPHFLRKCCKTIVLYSVWGPARYTEADEADEPDEPDEPDLSKMRQSRQLWPRVHRA